MTPNEKELYFVTYVSFDEEGKPKGDGKYGSYDEAVQEAIRRAAHDEEYDARYIFKAVAKVQNTPPELPVTTL